jgi:hypothetical protein
LICPHFLILGLVRMFQDMPPPVEKNVENPPWPSNS